ncbi:MAG: FadR family transcriptional regulator [Deltaproteobacteria bacterium]|nr:FadR family transcriptional regulator [Deltaproteobacteria bacterium]
MLKPIKQSKLSDEIVAQIQDSIKNRELQPNDVLPSEREMAKMLGVSRPPLREALNKLEAMGFIKIQRGRRVIVRSIGDAMLPGMLAKAMADDTDLSMQLLEVRKVLESWAASQACRFATEDELRELQDTCKEMYEDFRKTDLGLGSDAKFHMSIYKATHNVVFTHLMSTLFDLLWQSQKVARNIILSKEGNLEALVSQHLAILDAIKARDEDSARTGMLSHLRFVEKELRDASQK